METIPHCLENLSMVWQALKVARTQNPNLSTTWLKIADAYESIPNKPVLFILHRYGVFP